MFGITIEMIRKGKNIKIKDLCEGIMTRAAYHRFASGKSDTSIQNFTLLLDRLHTNSKEFFLIHNNYVNDKVSSFLKELSRAYRTQKLQELRNLNRKLESDFTGLKRDHLAELLKFRISRLLGQNIKGKESNLFNYLIKTEFWTHYELVLFTNSMFVFSLELIDAILIRCIQSFKKFSTIRPYGNESFRLVSNALIVAFEQNNKFYTKKWMVILEGIKLDDGDFFEKTLYMIFKGFNEININNNTESMSEIIKTIDFVRHIEANEHAEMFNRMLNFILEISKSKV